MFTINKKKMLYTFLIGVLLLSLLSGCKSNEEEDNNLTDNETISDTNTNDSENDLDEVDEEQEVNEETDLENNDNEETDIQEEESMVELVVYYGDENAEKIISHTVEVEEIRPETIIKQLQDVNVLPEGVQVLDFEEQKENGSYALHVDFSEAFQTQIFQMGTAGEYIIINSVVNTFLDAYEADKIRITVEGMVLESGHAIYDDYLFFQSEE